MSGISGIFILNNKGIVIIQRIYRSDLSSDSVETFNKLLIDKQEDLIPNPIIYDPKDHQTYIFKHYNNITILAISKKNVNTMMIITFIYQLIDIFIYYFKLLEEESIRDNFVVIYELLDEIMDNGFPQTTDFKILGDFIKTESHQLLKSPIHSNDLNLSKIATLSTSAITWRKDDIKYKKNEIYLDVIEKLNMLISKNGSVIEAETIGSVITNCMLSGLPECLLCINDKEYFESNSHNFTANIEKTISFDDLKFHQCVRLSTFQNERIISFIPPDDLPQNTQESQKKKCPDNCVVFYSECNFQGESYKLCQSSQKEKRVLYKSVFVPENIIAKVYSKSSYKGDVVLYDKSVQCDNNGIFLLSYSENNQNNHLSVQISQRKVYLKKQE
ncbi:hypothetical protein IMG5_114140 [Ichthyophthirius multifiliis]|uniref:MHD domain-containing protein n=1 Tax=Ichthyophthirius multifiliis TaxID=5932 RepID=G0QU18_ICHMU|nr:hypothetical protein IMG5_114140 [Ichthyophthirius multifiliis]EGR31285.1 hypothetical protein IMG5_114140 [Ichthyophthirius multifiliis]|eukprot:XP_004034771.1 hypothetical protein IMG5_114140 [Ichthyophthirius multifiliis]